MKAGVLTFPGSNCDHDILDVLARFFQADARLLWHGDRIEGEYDLLIIPGGFSYGDYLRSGAIARFSPAMMDVVRHAGAGRPLVGICNGFQILCEAHLLPGALIRNVSLKHICRDVTLRAETGTPFTRDLDHARQYVIPVSHGDGNFRADDDTLRRIEGEGQVAFRYLDNPNGSVNDIAGLVNEAGNVLGMMPHPERAVDPLTGGTDGAALLRAFPILQAA